MNGRHIGIISRGVYEPLLSDFAALLDRLPCGSVTNWGVAGPNSPSGRGGGGAGGRLGGGGGMFIGEGVSVGGDSLGLD